MLRFHRIERVFCYDEARFGLKACYRRRWCPCGSPAEWTVDDRYQWLWLLMASEPRTGESCSVYMPVLNTDSINAFLQEFGRQFPQQRIGILLDGHAAHRSNRLQLPHNVVLLSMPVYSPELNPAERVFKELRARLANIVFDSLEALEEALTTALSLWWDTPTLLQRLTCYPWWRNAIDNMKTSLI